MQLISKFNKVIRFLLCVSDIFINMHGLFLQKIKSITIFNVFRKVLNKSDRKPNKICVYIGSKFCNSSFKKLLKDNDTKCIQHTRKESLLLLKDLFEF